MADEPAQDIRNRTFTLACDIARLAARLPHSPTGRRIADQLIRAGTSVGANLEEAKAASSQRDFVHCLQVSLKEARETLYWLRICAELQLLPEGTVTQLIGECDQVARILGAIVVRTKQRMHIE